MRNYTPKSRICAIEGGVIVAGLAVDLLKNLFPRSVVVDRRSRPSYGYRAVHVIVSVEDKLVEIQIRTALQHQWAELSEKFSDVIDPAIKYGAGDDTARSLLVQLAELVEAVEVVETFEDVMKQTGEFADGQTKEKMGALRTKLPIVKQRIADLLQGNIAELEKRRKKE